MQAILEALLEIVKALPDTIFLATVILVLGIVLGSLIAFVGIKKGRWLGFLIGIYLSYARGVPLVVQLFIAQAALPKVIGYLLSLVNRQVDKITIPSFWIVIICYTLFEGAVESENIRGIVNAFDHSQYEAGLSIGMKPFQVVRRIAIPQMLYTAIPLFLNAFLKIVRTLSVAFLVGVIDIMASARYKAALSSEYIASYVAVALVYWGICVFVQTCLKRYESTLKYA